MRFLAALSVALLLASPVYAQSTGGGGSGGGGGGGSGTVTSVACPSATITTSGACNPLPTTGTANDVPTATGTANGLQDPGGLSFSGGNQLQVGNGSNAGTLYLDSASGGGVHLLSATTANNDSATLPDNSGAIAELNLAQTWTAAQTLPSPLNLTNTGSTALFAGVRSEASLSSLYIAGSFAGQGPNSTGANKTWGEIDLVSRVPTAGSEEGLIDFRTIHTGGVLTADFSIDNGSFYLGNFGTRLIDASGNLTGASLTLSGTTGSTQCLQANTSGVVSGTGSACGGSGSSGANPTATAGLSAVNGSATTFLRSDGAPAISQAIVPTWTGLHTFNSPGATSTPSVAFTGTVFSGGSGTTTFPNIYVNQGTAPTTLDASGTELGINAPSGFAGDFLDFHINGGSSNFSVSATGTVTSNGSITGTTFTAGATNTFGWTGRGLISSPAAGAVQFGTTDTATATAQTVSFQSSTTAGTAGANALLNLSKGATTGIGGDLTVQAAPTGTVGYITALKISHLGVASISGGFTVATLPASPPTGSRGYVTDQLTACVAAGVALVGGGSVVCPAFYNGTAWVGD